MKESEIDETQDFIQPTRTSNEEARAITTSVLDTDCNRWTPSGRWCSDIYRFAGFGWILCLASIGPGPLQAVTNAGSSHSYYSTWILIWTFIIFINVQYLSVRLAYYAQTTIAEAQAANNTRFMRQLNWLIAELSVLVADIPSVIAITIGVKLFFGWSYVTGVLLSLLPNLLFICNIDDRLHLQVVVLVVFLLLMTLYVLWSQTSYKWIDRKEVIMDWLTGFYNSEQNSLYLVVTIMGSVIAPHTVHLQMANCMNIPVKRTPQAVKEAVKYASYEVFVPIVIAFLVNMMMLSISSETVNRTKSDDQSGGLANLCSFFVGSFRRVGCYFWGLCLLFAGLSSMLSSVLAGQYIMDGFLNKHIPILKRAIITRIVTIAFCLGPAASTMEGEELSMMVNKANAALFFLFSFTLTPLVKYNCSSDFMGLFACKDFDAYCLYFFAFFFWFINALALSFPGAGVFGFAWTMEGAFFPTSAKFWLIILQLLLQAFFLWWQVQCIFGPVICPMKPLVEERIFIEAEFALHCKEFRRPNEHLVHPTLNSLSLD